MPRVLRLDRLVGREVYTSADRRLGRLEEFRVAHRGSSWIVTEYVIGVAGLMERLGLSLRSIAGHKRQHGYLARWDQIDLSNPDRPRLSCPVAELQQL